MDKLKREIFDMMIEKRAEEGKEDVFEKELIERYSHIKIEHYELVNDYYMIILGFSDAERHIYIGLPDKHPLNGHYEEENQPVLDLDGGQLYVGMQPMYCPDISAFFDSYRWIIGSLYCDSEDHILDAELIREMNSEEDAVEILFNLSTDEALNTSNPVATFDYVKEQGNKILKQLYKIESSKKYIKKGRL